MKLCFRENPKSNLVVRVVYKETKIFQTNKRCPFLIYLETIDPKELDEKSPNWEWDMDYLRYELGIIN